MEIKFVVVLVCVVNIILSLLRIVVSVNNKKDSGGWISSLIAWSLVLMYAL